MAITLWVSNKSEGNVIGIFEIIDYLHGPTNFILHVQLWKNFTAT